MFVCILVIGIVYLSFRLVKYFKSAHFLWRHFHEPNSMLYLVEMELVLISYIK